MATIKEGQKINGKYQIIEKIGEGATAKVYLAYDLINELNVSLKILKEDDITEKKIKNFKKEAKVISLLNHDNIIQIYEIDEFEGVHYIAQEYIEGMTLKDYIIKSDKIAIQEAQNIILQILKGLEHAHEKGVVHKDIKSQNILLSVNNEIKITDFGIADILEDDMTKTQSLMGTPQYVAPEVLNKGKNTHQTDIYSTGILLYELLIGHAPFTGEKPTIIIMKQLNQPLPSVKNQREEIPQSLENVLLKATAKKLENRYQTATEMLQDLETVFDINRIDEVKVDIKDDFDYEELTTTNLGEIKKINKEESNKKKKKKYLTLITVILAFITFLIALNLYFFSQENNLTMPDLSNKTLEESQSILTNLGIDSDNITITYEISEDVANNVIISTEPEAGKELMKDTMIELVISKGQEKIKLENYINQNIDDVEKLLNDLGLEVEIYQEYSPKDKGLILSQEPEADSEVAKGDTIKLIVSQGVKQVKVANLLGITEDEFDTWIEDNNLNSAKTFECNDTYDKGEIFLQDPQRNIEVEEDSVIKVSISTGTCAKEDDDTADTSAKDDDTSTTDNKS